MSTNSLCWPAQVLSVPFRKAGLLSQFQGPTAYNKRNAQQVLIPVTPASSVSTKAYRSLTWSEHILLMPTGQAVRVQRWSKHCHVQNVSLLMQTHHLVTPVWSQQVSKQAGQQALSLFAVRRLLLVLCTLV